MARFCKHCGAQLSDNAKFCKNCGQAVPAPASNNTQTVYQTPIQNVQMSVNGVCPNCGSQMRPGAKFCRVCGFRFDTSFAQKGAMYPQMNTGMSGQVKQKDPYKALRVILVIACISFSVAGILTIPGRISSVRSGASLSDAGSIIIESSGKLTDAQKAEYARIDAETDAKEAEGEIISAKDPYIHDGYSWYTGDGNGWLGENEKEETENE